MEAAGIEPVADSSNKTICSSKGGALGGALFGNSAFTDARTDPGLARLNECWPTLPAEVRMQIVVLVEQWLKSEQ